MTLTLLALPDELLAWLANYLDAPSAGRLAAASSVCKQLVHEKLVHEWVRSCESARAALKVPRRISFNAAGKLFIDSYVDAFEKLAPAARKTLVTSIVHEGRKTYETARMLNSTFWTEHSIMCRLKNTMKLRARTAAAVAAAAAVEH